MVRPSERRGDLAFAKLLSGLSAARQRPALAAYHNLPVKTSSADEFSGQQRCGV